MEVKIKKLDEKKLYGIGYLNERKNSKIFVPKSLPDEIVEIDFIKRKGKNLGRIKNIESASKDRIEPKCQHYNSCGGCSLQHINYEKQFEIKKGLMRNIFGFEINGIKAINQFKYRNRMDFIVKKVDHEIRLGLREPGLYYSFVSIDECLLMNEKCSQAFQAVNNKIKSLDVSVYDLDEHKGCLRYVVVQGTSINNLVSVLVSEDCDEKEIDMVKSLANDEKIDNFVINYTSSLSDISQDERFVVVKGNEFLEEEFLNKKFKYPFNGFFQRNPKQFEVLVEKIREIVKENIKDAKNRRLLDLFSGTGLFSVCLSDLFKETNGFELNENMVKVAKENAFQNKSDAKFFVKDLYKDKVEINQKDIILFDPPRAGLGKRMIKAILKNKPETIIYVSCNPRSQKSDFELLKSEYEIISAFWVDMFPQTSHIESVLILNRRTN